jgi:cyclophilin family peptidyl-prolyl cis-trans isomerase
VPSAKRQRKREGRQYRQAQVQAARKRAVQRRNFIRMGIVGAVVLVLALSLGLFGSKKKSTKVSTRTTTTLNPTATTAAAAAAAAFGSTACPPADASAPRGTTFKDSFQRCIDPAKHYTATITFDTGPVTVQLAADQSPVTVNNFVALARSHFYDGVVCHRVIKGFVDQCGDPQGTGSGGPGYTIGEEPPKSGKYAVGQLAMAKTGSPHSTGSQFFIIVGDQGAALPPQYSLLGTITAGLDVAKKIEADGADADPSPPKVVHKMVSVAIAES